MPTPTQDLCARITRAAVAEMHNVFPDADVLPINDGDDSPTPGRLTGFVIIRPDARPVRINFEISPYLG